MNDIIYIIIALVITENKISTNNSNMCKIISLYLKYVKILHASSIRFEYFMQCICKKLI